MGHEGPPKMPPFAEKPLEPAVQQETPAVEAQQEVVLEPVQETPQEEITTPVEPNPLELGGEYAGYSEAGMLEDKKNEAELIRKLDAYSGQLDGTAENYFGNTSPSEVTNKERVKNGVIMIKEIKQMLDKQLEGTAMKSAKNYSSLYDEKFRFKYGQLLGKYDTQQ